MTPLRIYGTHIPNQKFNSFWISILGDATKYNYTKDVKNIYFA